MTSLAVELLTPDERAEPTSAVAAADVTAESTQVGFPTPAARTHPPAKRDKVEVERPYGERGDFEKITVTVPRNIRDLLLDESMRRKRKRQSDWPIATVVREALAQYLGKKGA
jgi:hypothetical protein